MKSDGTMSGAGIVASILLVLAVLFGGAWIVQGNDFFMYKYFAPKYADAQRETYEHSRNKVQGDVMTLRDYQMQYTRASDETKPVLRGTILKASNDMNLDLLPEDLREWVNGLRKEQLGGK